MALTAIPSTPATGRASQEAVKAAAKELQRLKQVVVAGAAANTNIAISGIATADVLVGVVELVPATPALVSRTATTTITSAGNIQCSVSTAGSQLIVTYFDVA